MNLPFPSEKVTKMVFPLGIVRLAACFFIVAEKIFAALHFYFVTQPFMALP
jgi:hypothetical protein